MYNIMIKTYAKSHIVGSKIWNADGFYSTLNPNAKVFIPKC